MTKFQLGGICGQAVFAATVLICAPAYGDEAWAKEAAVIKKACEKDKGADCIRRFDRMISSSEQSTESVHFKFFGIGGNDEQSFSGFAHRIFYTEVNLPTAEVQKKFSDKKLTTDLLRDKPSGTANELTEGSIELQVGFGYRVYIKQRDAKPVVSGSVSALPFQASHEKSNSAYDVSIIGMAKGKKSSNCDTATKASELLLCAVTAAPSADQANFNATVTALHSAMRRLIAATEDANAEKITICPQIIGARLKRDGKKDEVLNLKPDWVKSVQTDLLLNDDCKKQRSNVAVEFYDREPGSSSITFNDGNVRSDRLEVVQRYARRPHYFPGIYDDEGDRYVVSRINIKGSEVKTPSLLGVILSAQATGNSVTIQVDSKLNGGLPKIGAKLPVDTASKLGDYQNYIDSTRDAVDED